ncbi:Methionine gamma-lyase [Chromobacterium violaceum]|uniref:Methionine gamma-lyase n=1 Tax=Chromobacterium violaceum TaxID=536 RepID=A0A3S4IFF1_CHRVL|nr:Methionine gamma-lyase [Chromobacterium violaceum]
MKLETLAVHAGYSPDPTTKAVAVPLYQTTSYAFDSTQHGADLFDLKVQGNIYTRIMNPTTDVLEKRIAALEAASARWRWPQHGGRQLFDPDHRRGRRQHRRHPHAVRRHLQPVRHTFPQLGIEVRFVDYQDPAAIAALVDDRTKAVFCESIGNPLGNVVDFAPSPPKPTPRPAADRRQHRALAYLCRPFEHGATSWSTA